MSSTATDLSSGLAPDEDRTLARPEPLPGFNETYCFTGYDPQAQLGWFFHLQSKPEPWRARFYAYLPGGQDFIYAEAFDAQRIQSRPGAAAIHAECVEPFQRWTLHVTATGRRTTRAAMIARTPPTGDPVELNVELDVRAVAPLWALGYGDGATAEEQGLRGYRTHHHQLMMASGAIGLDGEAFKVAGATWRDHSRGPRTLSTWGDHALVGAWFPQSRRGVGLIRQRDSFGKVMVDHAYVVEDGALRDAKVVEVTPYDGVDGWRGPVTVVVQPDVGKAVRLTGEIVSETLGPIGPSSWISEAQTRWMLDGETTYGLCERSSLGRE